MEINLANDMKVTSIHLGSTITTESITRGDVKVIDVIIIGTDISGSRSKSVVLSFRATDDMKVSFDREWTIPATEAILANLS